MAFTNIEHNNSTWVLCPICKNKTRIKIVRQTEAKNFPLFCPKCKNEAMVNIKNMKIELVVYKNEPDTMMQSR